MVFEHYGGRVHESHMQLICVFFYGGGPLA